LVQCPKDKKVTLVDQVLAGDLAVQCCPDCKGTWIPAEEYKSWQSRQEVKEVTAEDVMPKILEVKFSQPPLDTKAALCPDCNRYLSRAKVNLKNPFYVERCMACGGVWCDYGEWDVLQKLGLHVCIEKLFSSYWQERVKELEYAERERQATVQKLGEELAARVFELAELLEAHPNGDFGVAYLMRRFDNNP
jgi:Zn-finger nucleic acid-binding protein